MKDDFPSLERTLNDPRANAKVYNTGMKHLVMACDQDFDLGFCEHSSTTRSYHLSNMAKMRRPSLQSLRQPIQPLLRTARSSISSTIRRFTSTTTLAEQYTRQSIVTSTYTDSEASSSTPTIVTTQPYEDISCQIVPLPIKDIGARMRLDCHLICKLLDRAKVTAFYAGFEKLRMAVASLQHNAIWDAVIDFQDLSDPDTQDQAVEMLIDHIDGGPDHDGGPQWVEEYWYAIHVFVAMWRPRAVKARRMFDLAFELGKSSAKEDLVAYLVQRARLWVMVQGMPPFGAVKWESWRKASVML